MEMTTQTRLEYLRGELRAERISYGELAELQIHAENGDIDPGDLELLEAAGVPEFCPNCEARSDARHMVGCPIGHEAQAPRIAGEDAGTPFENFAGVNTQRIEVEATAQYYTDEQGLVQSVDALLKINMQLVDALRFYAKPENWKEQETGIGMNPSDADMDCGTQARTALRAVDGQG